MRMLCKSPAPPQLQGMEYPSPGPETPPLGGSARVMSGARGSYFWLFALNNSLARYVYYCSVQIFCKKKKNMKGAGEWNTSLPLLSQFCYKNFNNSTAMAVVNKQSFKIILMYFRYLRGSCCVICRTLCWCVIFVVVGFFLLNIRHTKPYFFSHLFQTTDEIFCSWILGRNREDNIRLP